MIKNSVRALTGACLASLGASTAAYAAGPLTSYPVTYATLETSGGLLNPGVIFAFNPQPDPPGEPQVNLVNPFEPMLDRPGDASTYYFVMSFTGLPGLLLPAVQMPDVDGLTSFTFDYNAHMFDVALAFAGPGAVRDWASFNPQPDPPGIWFTDAVTFGGDASVSFSMTEDGTALRFAIPEPATWTLMGLAFAWLGALGYRRAKRSPAFVSRA